MSHKILADECADFRIIRALRDRGFEVASILKQSPGLPDEEILDLAKVSQTLLLTEDSDFGRWVFAHQKKDVGVIFLRYAPDSVEKIVFALVHVLMTHQEALLQKFVVITPKKIRIRDL